MVKFDLRKFASTKTAQRVVGLGITGSGKTYFLKRYADKRYRIKNKRLIIADLKFEFGKIPSFNYDTMRVKQFKRKVSEMKVNGNEFSSPQIITDFCARIAWYYHPSILYIEEAIESISKADQLPISNKYVYKCLQQGRAKLIDVIVVSQSSAQLNLAFIRQASDIFVFFMRKTELIDVEKKLGLTKNSLDFSGAEQYSFYHLPISEDKPILYEPI